MLLLNLFYPDNMESRPGGGGGGQHVSSRHLPPQQPGGYPGRGGGTDPPDHDRDLRPDPGAAVYLAPHTAHGGAH